MAWCVFAPAHPLGIVSSRQRETRTIPCETCVSPAVPTCASNMRMIVPSFGAVLIGRHSGNKALSPFLPLTPQLESEFPRILPGIAEDCASASSALSRKRTLKSASRIS